MPVQLIPSIFQACINVHKHFYRTGLEKAGGHKKIESGRGRLFVYNILFSFKKNVFIM